MNIQGSNILMFNCHYFYKPVQYKHNVAQFRTIISLIIDIIKIGIMHVLIYFYLFKYMHCENAGIKTSKCNYEEDKVNKTQFREKYGGDDFSVDYSVINNLQQI